MSYDLKLVSQDGSFDLLNHDILISGTTQIVQNNNKLTQDIQKILLTTKNYFWTNYGTSIEALIGTNYGLEQTINILESQVVRALVYLQNLQNQQATYQAVTSQEIIEDILSVNVTYAGNVANPSAQNLTTFNVAIVVQNAAQSIVSISQNISLT